MSRRGRRVRIARNIYRDRSGIAVAVKVGGVPKERRFPPGTSSGELREARDELRIEARRAAAIVPTRRGTFGGDIARYLQQVQHLASWTERRSELRAWAVPFGSRRRRQITATDVRRIIGDWIRRGVAPKTCNGRLFTLRHLYRTLDGPSARTPCDEVRPLVVPATPKRVVPPSVVTAVEAQLRAWEATGRLKTAKTRARFMVLATTGRRPSELMRAQPEDVDLERRVWAVRTGKGGRGPGIYLNDEMTVAWQTFIGAAAWGPFEGNAYVRTLRGAGWPTGWRPYELRRSVAIAMLERQVDLADVSVHLGHTRIDTTRRSYTGIIGSRLQSASEAVDHRFGWAAPLAPPASGAASDD